MTAGVRSAYITALADCKHEECGVFKFTIDAKPKNNKESIVQVNAATVERYKVHTREKVKKRQLKGARRKVTQGKLDKEKASKVFNELVGIMDMSQYRSGNYTECLSKDVLKRARSEWHLHDILHEDPFSKLCIVTTTLESVDDESKAIKGYV